MNEISQFIHNLIDPAWITAHGGLYLVLFIVFAETGLFIGFFLPGDSLLFITGLIIKQSPMPFENDVASLIFWVICISIAGVAGNMIGYWFGKKSGPLLFERRETWLFKRHHLMSAKEFYEKKGGTAIIFARFLPIVRTFAPIVAGVVKMDYKKFMFFNIIGSFAWVISMVVLGFFLGSNAWVSRNLEYIVIGLVVVTTAPVLIKMIGSKKKHPIQTVSEDVVEEVTTKDPI